MMEVGEHKLFKLRCPIEGIQWNGEWAEGDNKWT